MPTTRRGRIVRPVGAMCPERRLLAAVILQALRDACRGDVEAKAWLSECGGFWADKIGLDGDRLAGVDPATVRRLALASGGARILEAKNVYASRLRGGVTADGPKKRAGAAR